MKTDCLIFDLDGTLWDSNAGCALAWNRVLQRMGIEYRSITESDIRGIAGRPHREAVGVVVTGLPPSVVDEVSLRTEREDIEVLAERGGNLYPGVASGIPELAQRRSLLIVSNCQAGYIEVFRRTSGLDACFDDHECWGNTGQSKSDNLAAIIARNNCSNPVFIGDTAGDHLAARDNGVPFVHAAYGFGQVPDADATLKCFGDLAPLLG